MDGPPPLVASLARASLEDACALARTSSGSKSSGIASNLLIGIRRLAGGGVSLSRCSLLFWQRLCFNSGGISNPEDVTYKMF